METSTQPILSERLNASGPTVLYAVEDTVKRATEPYIAGASCQRPNRKRFCAAPCRKANDRRKKKEAALTPPRACSGASKAP